MKKIFVFILMAACASVNAQQAKPYDMLINGVKVIVVPSGNDIVQVDFVIKGGVQNYTAAKAGIESLAMTALTECGTQKDTKNSFKNKLDGIDAKVYGYTGMDAAHVGLNCIKNDLETAWPLYVDALTAPRFDAKEFDRIKNNAINDLREQESNPDAALQKMAMQTAFKGKDYAKAPDGNIETVQQLSLQETKAYYSSILTRSRIFIVVVGDLTREELQKKMTALTARIPQGKPFELRRSTYTPAANTFTSKSKDLATNYVMGISGAPAANSKEYYPAMIASDLFYNKAFLEVRTNNGLSYAPAAWISSGLTPYSAMYVTTKEPDKYIAVARSMVDKIKLDGFPADDVQNTKKTFTTYQYYNNETNSGLASLVAGSEIKQGDWHKAFTLKEDLQPVTAADVNKVFNKYIGSFTWVYQGDSTKVNPVLYKQATTPPLQKDKKPF